MNRSLAVALCMVLTSLAGGEAWAKIAGPKPVAPVVHEGVKYLAPNNDGRQGRVEARKADTGEKLWEAVIYTVKIDPGLEEDVQWVFITALELDGGTLRVTDGKGEQHMLDLKTKKVAKLYRQTGTDPSFQSLLDAGRIPVGKSSREGVKGSIIDVNNAVVEGGENGGNPIPKDIRIHTLCHGAIARKDFPKWTRWYQEDGHTQVFRLFKGETNVHNKRKLAARIEAFSGLNWQQGQWHEWSGTYTIVRPHGCSIFQAKNNVNAWGVMINLSDDGTIVLNHRRHQKDVVLASNMAGKSFDLKVRDNGRDYEVFFNGKKVGSGYYDRPEGRTCFRWGMYLGEHEVRHEAMIFVTGARFK